MCVCVCGLVFLCFSARVGPNKLTLPLVAVVTFHSSFTDGVSALDKLSDLSSHASSKGRGSV